MSRDWVLINAKNRMHKLASERKWKEFFMVWKANIKWRELNGKILRLPITVEQYMTNVRRGTEIELKLLKGKNDEIK